MSETSSKTRLIAKNTAFLYFRVFFIMAVSLYTSRVILAVLGVNDFGIYCVIAGLVSILGFINGAMSTTSIRYITLAIHKEPESIQRSVFSTSMQIHLLIALIIVLFSESLGPWFIENFLNIDEERREVAFWVFQCSLLTTVISIINVPYNSAIISHEKMVAFTYISIIEALLKLTLVYLLSKLDGDKLLIYSILLLLVQLLLHLLLRGYCAFCFKCTKFIFVLNQKLFKEMVAFSGWNLIGNFAGLLSTEGINILLNMFFGPSVNGAKGIATQVQSAVNQFSSNLQLAINPQIIKNYSTGDLTQMHNLICSSSRYTFFVLYTISLPLALMTNEILEIWLISVPEYASVFVRLSLLIGLIDALTSPFMVSASATGKVRNYQLITGGIILLMVPIATTVLSFIAIPVMVYFVHLIISIVAGVSRLIVVSPLIKLQRFFFLKKVCKSVLLVVIVASPVPVLLSFYLQLDIFLNMIILTIVSIISSIVTVYSLGLDNYERSMIRSLLLTKLKMNKND